MHGLAERNGKVQSRLKLTLRLVCAAFLPAANSLAAQQIRDVISALPAPTGAYQVGTKVAYLADASRSDADFRTGRPITVQLWYPTTRASGRTAPYLYERGLAAALLRDQYYGIDSSALRAWAHLATHARGDAAPVHRAFPLIAFSVGLGVIRANYTTLAEDLASHGNIVAMVESPLQGYMMLPTGEVVSDTAGRYGEPLAHRAGVAAWSQDISYVLDALSGGGVPAFAAVRKSIDWKRVGAVGHSSGGIVAIATCQRDSRVRACVNLDGGVAGPKREPMADAITNGFAKPVIFIRSQPLYDDSTFARRGTTRQQWERANEAGRMEFDSLVARSRATITVAHVAGTGHFSFSDAPFVMPTTISRFGGRVIAPLRGWLIITSTLRAALDEQLNHHAGALAALRQRYPELTLK